MAAQYERTQKSVDWLKRVSIHQPDQKMPFGLVGLALFYFFMILTAAFVGPSMNMSLDTAIFLLPLFFVSIIIGIVFFAIVIALLAHHLICRISLACIYLTCCFTPTFTNPGAMPLHEWVLFPIMLAAALMIVTFPLTLMRVLAGWRLTAADFNELQRYPFSITKIFGFMIAIGAFLGAIIAISNLYQNENIFGRGDFIPGSILGTSGWFFAYGALHLPIFILGLRLKFHHLSFWIVVNIYWALPLSAAFLIAAFTAGGAPLSGIGLLTMNLMFNAFGFTAIVLLTRSFGYRLLFVPVTMRTGLGIEDDKEIDPFAD